MDPKTHDNDGRFFVLRDGEEIDYDEIPYSKYRTISILFVAYTQEIESPSVCSCTKAEDVFFKTDF